MTKRIILAVILFTVGLTQIAAAQTQTTTGQGQPGYYYLLGVEGFFAPSLPPPGLSFKDYNAYIQTTTLNDAAGHNVLPPGSNIGVGAVLPRVIYVPDWKGPGGMVFMTSLFMGAFNINQNLPGVTSGHGTHLMDPDISTFIGWHKKKFDLAIGLENVIPLGAYGTRKPGIDNWTEIPSVGIQYYLDSTKKTSILFLPRYEWHSKQRHADVQMGNDFHIEYGVARSVHPRITIGPMGYCEWKVTRDKGSDITWDPTVKTKVYGLGPEIDIALPNGIFLQARGVAEFGAKGQTSHNGIFVSFFKHFDFGKGQGK